MDSLTKLNKLKIDFFKQVFGQDYHNFILRDLTPFYRNPSKVKFLDICTDTICRIEYLKQSSITFLKSLNILKLNMIRTDLEKIHDEYSSNPEKLKEAIENLDQLKESIETHRKEILNINIILEMKNRNLFIFEQIKGLLDCRTSKVNYDINILVSDQLYFEYFIRKEDLLEKVEIITNQSRLDSNCKETIFRVLNDLSY